MTPTQPKLYLPYTHRPRLVLALHAGGIKESPSVWAGSETDFRLRLLSGTKPVQTQGLLRVRPSDTRQSVWSLRCQPIKTAVEPESGNALDGEQSPATRTRGSAAMREPEHQTAESSVTGGYAGEGIAVYPEALSRQGGRNAKPTKARPSKTTGIRGALCPDETIGNPA